MTLIAFIRHGPTTWNEEHRLQGTTDVPLSEVGRALVASWRLPEELAGFAWAASPLGRAVDTARLLGGPDDIETDPRLIEMGFGEWEGRRLKELRAEMGAAMRANESRGLDFQPPGGESPRMVTERVAAWLAERARLGRPTIAVAHHGIIRATLALATGWQMFDKYPEELGWAAAHMFRLDEGGAPSLERLNIRLGEDPPHQKKRAAPDSHPTEDSAA